MTHNFKLGLTYELPFGQGKKWMTGGIGAQVLGGGAFPPSTCTPAAVLSQSRVVRD